MLFVSLKVEQFLDALVFLFKIPPQLDQLALVFLIFSQRFFHGGASDLVLFVAADQLSFAAAELIHHRHVGP
jgi:hypothetical protein